MAATLRLTLLVGGVVLILIGGVLAIARREPPQSSEIVYISPVDDMLYLVNIENKRQLRLTHEGTVFDPVWSPDGKWIYFVGNHWDIYRMRANGTALKRFVGDGISNLAEVRAKVSPNAEWISYLGEAANSPVQNLFVIRPDGSELKQLTTLIDTGSYIRSYWWSPDGSQLLLAIASGSNAAGLIIKIDGTEVFSVPLGYDPIGWTSKSNEIFIIKSDGNIPVFARMQTDGSNIRELYTAEYVVNDSAISPNGESIVYSQFNPTVINYSMYQLSENGQGVEPLVDDIENVFGFVWSSDSQWIAFAGVESGQVGLYVIKADGSNLKYLAPLSFNQISLGFAWRPVINLEWNIWWHLLGGMGIIILGRYWRLAR